MAVEGFMDISMTGDKQLMKMFARLPDVMEKKIARQAIRKSAKRLQPHIAAAIPLGPSKNWGEHLRSYYLKAPIRSGTTRREFLRVGIKAPERTDIGIPWDATGFYPASLEYGWKIRTKTGAKKISPKSFIRRTVDFRRQMEFHQMGRDIAKIVGEARRLAKSKAI